MTTVQLCATVTTFVFVLSVTAAAPVYLEHSSRALLKNVVSASSRTRSNGGDSISETFVSSKVINEAKDALARSITTSLAEVAGGGNIAAEAEASAEAVATAFIQISSNGRSISTVTGDGEACGEFFASAESSATIVANAVADAFAQAENEFAVGDSTTVSEAVKEATLEVAATITGQACSTGGVAEAVESLIAEQELKVIATAFVRAYSEVAGENAQVKLDSKASAKKESDGQLVSNGSSNVNGKGDASTSASATVTICDNKAKGCCERRKTVGNICDCGDGCTAKFKNGAFTVFDNGEKTSCKCE